MSICPLSFYCFVFAARSIYLLDHARFGAHDLDPVGVIGQLVRCVGEEAVHDRRVQHEIRPETRRQRLHLHKIYRTLL